MLLIRKNSIWRRRFYTIIFSVILFAMAIIIVLKVFNDNIVFYLSPSELQWRSKEFKNREIRVGGMVVAQSIKYLEDKETIEFRITDLECELAVHYHGSVPNLFAEKQGSVVLGKLNEQGIFIAKEILAKHDEKYMPREVAESLGL